MARKKIPVRKWRKQTYAGRVHFQCELCPFDTFDEAAMTEHHVDHTWPPAQPSEAAKRIGDPALADAIAEKVVDKLAEKIADDLEPEEAKSSTPSDASEKMTKSGATTRRAKKA